MAYIENASYSNPDDYNLLPLDLSKYETGFHRRSFTLTKKNPFTTMKDEDWLEYIASRSAHFTMEPHYDIIPWEKLKVIEQNASNAGWELILRTTNNSVYCPPAINYKWYQCTQWIFGYPEHQLLLVLSYTESKFTLSKDIPDDKIALDNYFKLKVVSTTKPKHYTEDDIKDEYDSDWDYDCEYDCNSNRPKVGDTYYEMIKPVYGWVMNGGMFTKGNSNNNYMFVGDTKPDCFGLYRSYNNEPELTKEEKIAKQKTLIETMLPPAFWNEWIDKNKTNLMPGKFEEPIQITNWDNTYVLPGGMQHIKPDDILSWDMSYKFIQKLIDSNITKWINDAFGYNCCGDIIHRDFWSKMLPWKLTDNPQLHSKACILQCIPKSSNSNNWVPFTGYTMSLFQQKEIKFSDSAKHLIDEVWNFINSKN